MGSHFAQNTTSNPCSLLSCHKPLSGICTYTKHPQPTPKHPLSWPDFVGKMNYRLGKMDPIWAKCLKSGQNFSRSGQKKFIHQDAHSVGQGLTVTAAPTSDQHTPVCHLVDTGDRSAGSAAYSSAPATVSTCVGPRSVSHSSLAGPRGRAPTVSAKGWL